MCGKHWIEQTPSLQEICLRLIIPPKISTAPKISSCSVANPENTYVLINGVLQYQHDREIGTVARLAATSRIAARRSAIQLDFSISHHRNSVLILCIIVGAVFFVQGSTYVGWSPDFSRIFHDIWLVGI